MYVDMNIQTDPEFMLLLQPATSMEITTHPNGDATIGYDNNGIIVYNTGDYREPFYAFDRTCPNELPESVAIELDGNMAVCPVCNSVYMLPSEGIPAIGSASKYYLKKYHTSYNPNTGDLIISN